MTTAAPVSRSRKPLDAGAFEPTIGSFRLHLAAEAKAPRTVRTYTDAVRWFAAAHLIQLTSHHGWDEVTGQDVQRWMAWLLGRYSDAYASNQYRALQQFFRWWADEEELPDPMARLHAPKVIVKLVPVFTSGELSALEQSCQGRGFAQRRDHAIISVFRATGIRLSEMAGIRYDPGDPYRSDVDLCGGRSWCAARAAGRGSPGSVTTPPGAWTGTSAPGPGTCKRTGRSCGWA